MTARRAITLLAGAVACVLVFAPAAHAQSPDEPPLEQRLRGYLLKLPDQTKEVAPPTEAERLQEDARRARRSREDASRSSGGRGYIGPLSTETPTGRMGVSGWTGPSADPLGSAGTLEQKAGHFGFGYSVEWGDPRRSSFQAP